MIYNLPLPLSLPKTRVNAFVEMSTVNCLSMGSPEVFFGPCSTSTCRDKEFLLSHL